ncbi:MAG: peptide chain release factor N(5)-glutamine methyltransferase, partial [Bacteroidetes bacterium]
APLPPEALERLRAIGERLASGEPVQYVLGQADFYGLKFRVSPAVLIPRPETEELVAEGLKFLRALDPEQAPPTVLDVGTGSGCIALTLKKHAPRTRVLALDLSAEALEVARENARSLQLEVEFLQGDILDPASWAHLPPLDLLISNPPYIAPEERSLMPRQVLEHEPPEALFTPTADPLVFYRALARLGKEKLRPQGLLLAECNEFRAGEIQGLLQQAGYAAELLQDLEGKDRMVKARPLQP